MISLPVQRLNLEWHQDPRWLKWIIDLFRVYTRKRTYRLKIDTGGRAQAMVIPEARLLVLDSTLDKHLIRPGMQVRDYPDDVYDFRTRLLRAYVAHEAGHVRYTQSEDWPRDPVHARMVNCLEDERIERLMMKRYPELVPDFDMMNDLYSEFIRCGAYDAPGTPPTTYTGTASEGCLVWMWEFDRPESTWTSSEPELWAQVRPLVEAAWEAPNTGVVNALALEILKLLPPQEEQHEPSSLHLVSMSGANADVRDGSSPVYADPQTDQQAQAAAEAAEAAQQTPGGANGTPSSTPPPPARPSLILANRIADGAESLARQIAPLLKPRQDPAVPMPDISRGRFNATRYINGRERVFMHKAEEGAPRDIVVRMLMDDSASMQSGDWDLEAKKTALMFARAASLVSSRFELVAFDYQPHDVGAPGISFEDLAELLAARPRPGGGTRLAPALEDVCSRPVGANEQGLVVIVTDGELDRTDLEHCRAVKAAHPHLCVVPVLLGQAGESSRAYHAAFGTAVIVQDTEALAQSLATVLIRLRREMPRSRV